MTANENPYDPVHFLPAGSLHINVSLHEARTRHTASVVSDSSWTGFDASIWFLSVTTQEDDTVLRHLEFLVKHKFIQATCRLGDDDNTLLYIRIYIIPFDLASVQGQLRVRDETIMSPAREYLRHLLPQVRQGAYWDGTSSAKAPYLILHEIDNRTMPEIYSDLPSPVVNPDLAGPLTARLLAGCPIDGLESVLHSYQRRSVAAMVQKELYACKIPDPLYVPITGVDGKVFYLQPTKMEVLRECPYVASNRGGVLCEELGTGKTVMMLALILATLDQLSTPEESILDIRPVLTPLALKYFPSEKHYVARKRSRRGRTKAAAQPEGFPSLLEIMVHYVRVTDGLDLQVHEEELRNHQLWDPIALNAPFYHHYDVESLTSTFRGRSTSHEKTPPRVIYLTNATLIIVPINLLGQWESEINKHCYSSHLLRVLVVQKPNALPDARKLASDYDIILIAQNIFSSEAKASDLQKLHAWNICTCPNYPDPRVRVPNCHCTEISSVSSLLQIRWKRLVIDEGHVSATIATNLTPFAKLLSVERRWIVSGTPTTNLLGLAFGGGIKQVIGDDTEVLSSDEVEQDGTARKWSKNDREDLRKLGTMIIHFLCVPQFAVEPKLFDTHLIAPLFPREKLTPEAETPQLRPPQPAAIRVLEQVMGTVMIRHRIEDVEADITLPPITHEHILLDLEGASLKSYNAMQAIFAINAVDSQRQDQDYFFHKRNVGPLNNALQNMSQIMFWHSDSNMYNVATHVSKGELATLEDPKLSNISSDDRDLLHQAFFHMTAAHEDSTWKDLQEHLDVFYQVENLPRAIHNIAVDQGFIRAERLLKLRDFVNENPLASETRIEEWGKSILENERVRHRQYLESLKKRKRRGGREDGEGPTEGEKALRKRVEIAREAESAAVLPQAKPNGTESVAAEAMLHSTLPGAALLALSPVAQVRLVTTTSQKLNYILAEVQQHASDEKFLIFSNSPLTLAHIAEGLSLIRVKHLAYTSEVKVKEREQQVLTFETSNVYRVFLMELKHGARGLNLITASRVIFCEPVWRADVESQAIKRAHRIGQTRPITVKTLAIRSTMEEMMISRRSIVQHTSDKASNNWADEAGMRDFIANPKFLSPVNAGDITRLDIPLIDVPSQHHLSLVHPPVPLQEAAISAYEDLEEAPPTYVDELGLEAERDANIARGEDRAVYPMLKKRRVVRFADE